MKHLREFEEWSEEDLENIEDMNKDLRTLGFDIFEGELSVDIDCIYQKNIYVEEPDDEEDAEDFEEEEARITYRIGLVIEGIKGEDAKKINTLVKEHTGASIVERSEDEDSDEDDYDWDEEDEDGPEWLDNGPYYKIKSGIYKILENGIKSGKYKPEQVSVELVHFECEGSGYWTNDGELPEHYFNSSQLETKTLEENMLNSIENDPETLLESLFSYDDMTSYYSVGLVINASNYEGVYFKYKDRY